MENRFRFHNWRTFPSYGFFFGQLLCACVSLHGTSARAEGVESELAGAWAEPGNCDVTFVAKNGGWAFREPRDMGGLGFIVIGRQYDGPFGQCSLTSTTHQGDKDILSLACHNTAGEFDQTLPIQVVSGGELRMFWASNGTGTPLKKCGPK